MQVLDVINEMGGLRAMARELGVSESEVASGAAALLPAILGGFKKQTQARPGELEGLAGMLGGLGGGGLLDEVLGPQPTKVSRGNDVLGQIFGSREVSRTVAQRASGQTGLDPALLKKMLPILAMLVAGYVARQGERSTPHPAGGAGGLGGMYGGAQASAPRSTDAPGLASVLDLDGDGNPLDDIIGLAGKLMR